MMLKRRLLPYRRHLAPLAKKLGYMVALSAVERKILLAQIEDANPDIILNQVPEIVTADILNQVKRSGRVIIVQHGNQPPDDFDASPYTFGISLIPAVVDFFRQRGIPAENCHLAFDSSVLDRLGPEPGKNIEVSFVGGLSAGHGKRIELLEAIARELPIELYLSGFKGVASDSPLHRCVRGEVWGRDMYDVLRRSKVTLNSHIDAAKGMAGNMRLYEATGVGTFLLTDNLPNLPDLFQPGVHVGTYDSASDCVAKIKYYLSHQTEREAIARQGQQHTLQQHTYRKRLQELLELVEKYAP
jgi:spore maturation protein CgeB